MTNLNNKWLIGSISAALLSGAALWEGYSPTVYKDVKGIPTYCYGETENVLPGRTYSKQECQTLLKNRLAEYGAGVLKCTNVPISQSEYDAYTLFAYNVGISAFCSSRANQLLNQGKHEAACTALAYGPNQQPVWSFSGGKFYQGLHNRRIYEMKLCLGNKSSNTPL